LLLKQRGRNKNSALSNGLSKRCLQKVFHGEKRRYKNPAEQELIEGLENSEAGIGAAIEDSSHNRDAVVLLSERDCHEHRGNIMWRGEL